MRRREREIQHSPTGSWWYKPPPASASLNLGTCVTGRLVYLGRSLYVNQQPSHMALPHRVLAEFRYPSIAPAVWKVSPQPLAPSPLLCHFASVSLGSHLCPLPSCTPCCNLTGCPGSHMPSDKRTALFLFRSHHLWGTVTPTSNPLLDTTQPQWPWSNILLFNKYSVQKSFFMKSFSDLPT